MTKKDYELIAKIISQQLELANPSVIKLMISLATAFQNENPKFNTDKFLKACLLNELI